MRVQSAVSRKGKMYVMLPHERRGCFHNLNPWPPGCIGETLQLHQGPNSNNTNRSSSLISKTSVAWWRSLFFFSIWFFSRNRQVNPGHLTCFSIDITASIANIVIFNSINWKNKIFTSTMPNHALSPKLVKTRFLVIRTIYHQENRTEKATLTRVWSSKYTFSSLLHLSSVSHWHYSALLIQNLDWQIYV